MNNHWQTKTLPRISQGKNNSQAVKIKDIRSLQVEPLDSQGWGISFICLKSHLSERICCSSSRQSSEACDSLRNPHPGQQWFLFNAKMDVWGSWEWLHASSWTCAHSSGFRREQNLFTVENKNHITQMGCTSKAEDKHQRNLIFYRIKKRWPKETTVTNRGFSYQTWCHQHHKEPICRGKKNNMLGLSNENERM